MKNRIVNEFSEQGENVLRRLILQTAVNLTVQLEAFSIEPWDWRNIKPAFNLSIYDVFYTDYKLEKPELIQIMESEAIFIYESIKEFVGVAEPKLSHVQARLITSTLFNFQTFANKHAGLIEPRNWIDQNSLIE